jgi:hypothetical protein
MKWFARKERKKLRIDVHLSYSTSLFVRGVPRKTLTTCQRSCAMCCQNTSLQTARDPEMEGLGLTQDSDDRLTYEVRCRKSLVAKAEKEGLDLAI